MKKCRKCEELLELSNFSKYARGKDGYKTDCKVCIKTAYKQLRVSKGLKIHIDRTVETESTKVCTKCLDLLDISKFSLNNSWCNPCRTADNRDRLGYSEKIKPVVLEDSKECCKCREIKHIDNYYPNKRGRLGLSAYCKSCTKTHYKSDKSTEYTTAYRERHRHRYLAAHRLHQFKRKQLISATCDGTLNDITLKVIYDTEHCYYCRTITDVDNRTLEHKIPLIKGGTHSITNCVMACKKCNCSKGSKTDIEYFNIINNDRN
jgi:5-methylcytosine-specific restriction endonuclease McrA